MAVVSANKIVSRSPAGVHGGGDYDNEGGVHSLSCLWQSSFSGTCGSTNMDLRHRCECLPVMCAPQFSGFMVNKIILYRMD